MIERSSVEAKQANQGRTAFSILRVSLLLAALAMMAMFLILSLSARQSTGEVNLGSSADAPDTAGQ